MALKQDIQKATFTRTATKDTVTGKITYSAFKPDSITLPAVTKDQMPKIDGYEVLSTTEDIPALKVTSDSASQTVDVYYRKVTDTADTVTLLSSSDPNYWYDYANNKHKINTTYELGNGEGDTRQTNNKWIIAHSTATPNATAENEAKYFKNNWSSAEAYVQLVVDDKDAYKIGDFGWVAWGAGQTGNLNSPVQIELCEFPNDKTRALKAYWNYVSLLRQYAKIYNIPIKVDENYPASGIDTHAYLAQNNHETSHTDPYTYLESIGISKAQFKYDVEHGIQNNLKGGSSSSSESGSSTSGSQSSTPVWTPESATFTATTRRKIYNQPVLNSSFKAYLEKGMSVVYNAKWNDGKYMWLRYTSYSGSYQYIIYKNEISGKTFGTIS